MYVPEADGAMSGGWDQLHKPLPLLLRRWWWALALGLPVAVWASEPVPMKVDPFYQEVSAAYGQADGLPSNNVTSIVIAANGDVYAGTLKGLACFNTGKWVVVEGMPRQPVYRLCVQGDQILAALEGGLYLLRHDQADKLANLPTGTVRDLAVGGKTVYLATDRGLYFLDGRRWKLDKALGALLEGSPVMHAVAFGPGKAVVAGAAAGLFRQGSNGAWRPLYPRSRDGRSWAPREVRGVAYDNLGRLWFASPQGVGRYDGEWTFFTGQDGLPYNDFTCLGTGANGAVWLGTRIGAIRYDEGQWAYRQGKRWLPHDEVNDLAVTADGDVWLATNGGVGLIQRVPMTLAEKAAYYEEEIEKYIKRTRYGYVSEARLERAGDKVSARPEDSDNDGLWTSMYGVGESFAYAVTGDPQAKGRAREVFEALRFLGTVTQGGQVRQQPGFIARTVVPTSEPDPNQRPSATLEGMKRFRQTRDKYWKVYYPRWPLSANGKYWYKTDTSSDELDGHYFFYALYYDLAAETEAEREPVRQVVRAITDHLIRNDYALVDHDGTPTRWGVFSPAQLNHDPRRLPERGLNSLSMLSYLAVAEHITGDPQYGAASRRLQEEHAYLANATVPKLQRGAGSGNQSDDEMAFMNYYTLIKYTKDKSLRQQMLVSFYNYWVLEFPEMNPFFNFAYAACALGQDFTDAWGTYGLDPWDGWLEDGIATLKGFPLDRINWAHKNSQRLDIAPLSRVASADLVGPADTGRGYRVNGKVLPVEERHFNHWNHDPWRLDTGGNGHSLGSGAVFLLPYYMGLYHGFIE